MSIIYIITPVIVFALYKRVLPFKNALQSKDKGRIKFESALLIAMVAIIVIVYSILL